MSKCITLGDLIGRSKLLIVTGGVTSFELLIVTRGVTSFELIKVVVSLIGKQN